MADAMTRPDPTDIIAVKSRVSWQAIFAGAMVAVTFYVVLMLLGVALFGEAVARNADGSSIAVGGAIYTALTLLISFFFGGWATSRLAVGESKLEAVLYGLILWGTLFVGLIWLLGAGIRTGFAALLGAASGVYQTESGEIDVDRVAADLRRSGADEQTVSKYRNYYEQLRRDPASAPEVGRELSQDPGAVQTASEAARAARSAAWWTLLGVIVSLATVVVGSLVGSGEILQPLPIIGVRRSRT